MRKNIYCTLDTETVGGASCPQGVYHLAGIIHDRQGNILDSFNYVIEECYKYVNTDNYAKKNLYKYAEMIKNGEVELVETEFEAIELVNDLLLEYDVKYLMAYNSGFDFEKTVCRHLLEEEYDREFIDLWLMAVQTIAWKTSYRKFCAKNDFYTSGQKNCKCSAEIMYRYLINDPHYEEEHTALEDSKIEMAIFVACIKRHKKFTKNCHYWNYHRWDEKFVPLYDEN